MNALATILVLTLATQTAPPTPDTSLHGTIGTIGRIKSGKDVFLLDDLIWIKEFRLAVRDYNAGGEGAQSSLDRMLIDGKTLRVPGGSRIRIVNLKRSTRTNEIFAQVEVLNGRGQGARGWIATNQLEKDSVDQVQPRTRRPARAKAK